MGQRTRVAEGFTFRNDVITVIRQRNKVSEKPTKRQGADPPPPFCIDRRQLDKPLRGAKDASVCSIHSAKRRKPIHWSFFLFAVKSPSHVQKCARAVTST